MGLLDFFSDLLGIGDEDKQTPQDTTSQHLLAQQAQPPTGQSMLQAQLPGQPMQGGIDQAASPTALMTLLQLQQPPSLGSVMGRDNPYATMIPEPKAPSKLDAILSGFSAAMKVAGGIQAMRGKPGPRATIQAMGTIAKGVHDFTTEAYLRTQAHQQQVNDRIKSLLEMANQERAIKMQGLEAQGNLFTTTFQQGGATQAYGDYITKLFNLPQNSLRTDILPQGLTEELLKINPTQGLKEVAKRTGRPVEELMQGAYLVSPAQQEFNFSMMSLLAQEAPHVSESHMRETLARLADAQGGGMSPELLNRITPLLMGAAGSELREIVARHGPPGDKERRVAVLNEGLEYARGLTDQYKLDFPAALGAAFRDKPEFMSAYMEWEASFNMDPNQIRQQVQDMGEQVGLWGAGGPGGGLGGMPGMPGAGGGLDRPISPEAAKAFMEKTKGKSPVEVAQMQSEYFNEILTKYIPRAAQANALMNAASLEAFQSRMSDELARGKAGQALMQFVDEYLQKSELEFNDSNLDLAIKAVLRDHPDLSIAVQNPDFYADKQQATPPPLPGVATEADTTNAAKSKKRPLTRAGRLLTTTGAGLATEAGLKTTKYLDELRRKNALLR